MHSLLILAFAAAVFATARGSAQVTVDAIGFAHVALPTNQPEGQMVRPQVSSDLRTWRPLNPATVGPNGILHFSDFSSLGQRQRFYRAVSLPPPGSFLIYERRAADGSHVVMRCRIDGRNETCLTPGHYPRVSPNGRWVIFTRDGTGPSFHTGANIYVIDLTEPEPAEACGYKVRRLYLNTTGEELINFAWHQDSVQFIFDCGGRLYQMTADGGGRQPYFPDSDCVEAMPSFAPDGRTLAFAHRLPSQVTARRPGAAKQPLTPPGLGDSWPQWSPDGSKIVICDGNSDLARTDLGRDLVLVDPTTGARSQLTQLTESGDGFPHGGTWSADSLWIYAAGTVDGIKGVWRIPASGGPPQAVPINSIFDPSPGISFAPVAFVGNVVP